MQADSPRFGFAVVPLASLPALSIAIPLQATPANEPHRPTSAVNLLSRCADDERPRRLMCSKEPAGTPAVRSIGRRDC